MENESSLELGWKDTVIDDVDEKNVSGADKLNTKLDSDELVAVSWRFTLGKDD